MHRHARRLPGWALALAILTACRAAPATDGGAEQPREPWLEEVRPLGEGGVRGAELAATVPGTPDEVLRMLVDFEDADGRRAWARSHELLARHGEPGEDLVVRARWRFEGKLGIDPVAEIVFEEAPSAAPSEGGTALAFHLAEPVFGLAVFRGRWILEPAGPDATRVLARVFVSSGLPLADASAEDLASGLEADARAMHAWMRERVGGP